MKNSGKCPKCNGAKIYVKQGSKHGNGCIRLASTRFSDAKVDYYICSNCGYVEQYLHKIEKLNKHLQHQK